MPKNKKQKILKLIVFFALAWTVVLAGLYSWSIKKEYNQTFELSKYQAQTFFQDIVTTRLWNAGHGGIYVPVTVATKPNPYLKDTLRDIETINGLKLTKINPAYMTRQIGELAEKRDLVWFHITSNNPIRPHNAPDKWESAILKSFETDVKEFAEFSESKTGKEIFRYMAPLWAEQACLKCHTTQKKGDLRGGISVTIDAESILKTQENYIFNLTILHVSIWGIGVLILFFGGYQLNNDITQIIKIEDELKLEKENAAVAIGSFSESERKLSTLISNLPGTAYRCLNDENWTMLFLSDGCYELTGYKPSELIDNKDLSYENLIVQEDREYVQKGVQRAIEKGQAFALEYRIQDKNKNLKWIWEKGQGVYDEGKNLISLEGFLIDISKEKTMIESLNLAKNGAEAATKSKSEFLANMSHEIRTPLNGVTGMIDMLLDTKLTEEQYDFAVSVGASADSLLVLVNDILDFSKIEARKLDIEAINFDLRSTIESLCDQMALTAYEKRIEFACLIHNKVPCFLKGDPGRIRQILTNLLGNAIKFVEKGEVSLSVDLKKETDHDATLLFKVNDTGIGIPQDTLSTLFESFTQADASMARKYGGTGLGLTISKQLSEMMGGQIGVESQIGKGSTFWFTIVVEKQKIINAKEITLPENLKDKKILVVDDHSVNRMVFKEYLKSWNCRFDEAENGKQALSKLKDAVDKKDPFHIAIINMHMPEMNGETLGIKIKESADIKGTKLVMATSMGQRGDAKKMEEFGFAAFITKPVKKTILFDCLRMVLSDRKYLSKDSLKPIITKFTIQETKNTEKENDGQLNVLLTEDNLMNQKVAKNMLKKMGHIVVIANNGKEAVELFANNSFDIILMDGQMPVMDGMEATKEIRIAEQKLGSKNIPIIAVTANAMKGDREKFLAAGMDDYISKPLKRKKLEAAITKLID